MVGRKEGDDQLCGVDVVPLLFAIAGCHSSVLWLGGDGQLWGSGRGAGCHSSVLWLGGDDQLWGSGRGAGCHSSVLWLGGDDQLWGSGRGAGCHCNVLWWGEGKVTTNFGGVDVVQGAIVMCYGGGRGR